MRLFGAPGEPLATALQALMNAPHVALVVAEDDNGVAGTARRGVTSALLSWGIDEARRRGCARIHLDSGLTRGDLRDFYSRFGFEYSYQGFSRVL
ncbi:GNAT family N-acetyltransferase [Amycolatopsis plumensis]|uniref:GNAT family N-acetyltransferase n=1 Tax=Amycolatopsis plumensis TaxID=236508 RepID=A0ABV5U5G2_9PSEU